LIPNFISFPAHIIVGEISINQSRYFLHFLKPNTFRPYIKHGLSFFIRYHATLALANFYLILINIYEIGILKQIKKNPIRLKNGCLIHVPENDWGIGKELLHGYREKYASEYLYEFLSKNEVILDIGANIGYYVILEHHASPESKIYAIEPVSETVTYLKMNAPQGASIYQYAISDHDGKVKMYSSERCNLSSVENIHGVDEHTAEEVPSFTLDTFCENEGIIPTVLRMDTEGHEIQIIKGAKGLIESDLPLKMFIEHHPCLTGAEAQLEIADYLQRYEIHPDKIFIGDKPARKIYVKLMQKAEKIRFEHYPQQYMYMSSREYGKEELDLVLSKSYCCWVFWKRDLKRN